MVGDIFDDSFAQSSCIPSFDSDLLLGHNPVDWINSLKVRHSDAIPLEQVTNYLSYED